MRSAAEMKFGADIWDAVDVMYGFEDRERRQAYVDANPRVEQVLDWQTEAIMGNQLLSAYYMSIDKVEKYMKGQMTDYAEQELGPQLWEQFEVWERLKGIDEKAARQAWKDYNLSDYMDIKDEWGPRIQAALVQIGGLLPVGEPAEFRDGRVPEGGFKPQDDKETWIRGQMTQYLGDGVAQVAAPRPQMDLSYILSQPGGPELLRLIMDGGDLPEVAERRVSELGLTVEQIIAGLQQ